MSLCFTARQKQIIEGIGRGDSYKEIGARLNISAHTVRATVIQIASRIEEFDDLPPRWRILAYTKGRQWDAMRETSPAKTA